MLEEDIFHLLFNIENKRKAS